MELNIQMLELLQLQITQNSKIYFKVMIKSILVVCILTRSLFPVYQLHLLIISFRIVLMRHRHSHSDTFNMCHSFLKCDISQSHCKTFVSLSTVQDSLFVPLSQQEVQFPTHQNHDYFHIKLSIWDFQRGSSLENNPF